jgi:intraflagellar transport protein 56
LRAAVLTISDDRVLLQNGGEDAASAIPSLEELVARRDFTGAITLLQATKGQSHLSEAQATDWLAYCHFHAGDFSRALHLYETLAAAPEAESDSDADSSRAAVAAVHAAACLFYLGRYADAEAKVATGARCALANRILLHCAHAAGDEEALVQRNNTMAKDCVEDQLSLAAIHFRRSHFQVRAP